METDRLGLSGLGQSGFEKAKSLGTPWAPVQPKLLLSGKPAASAAAQVMVSAPGIVVPSNLGMVSLVPGTAWSGNKVLVQAQLMTVQWMVDDRLYEWGTQNFINCEWFDAIAKGASRAQSVRRLLRIEMELLTGLFVPFYLVLGSSVAKSTIFYLDQKQNLEIFKANARVLIESLRAFEKAYPALYRKLRNSALKEFLIAFPDGIRSEDIAFFVGRVIRGAVGATEVLALGQRLTLPALLKIAGVFAVLVTIAHSPAIGAHAAEKAFKNCLSELNKDAANISFTEGELKQVADEFKRSPTSLKDMMSTRKALNEIASTLQQMLEAYDKLD